jgi:hypothetical protein
VCSILLADARLIRPWGLRTHESTRRHVHEPRYGARVGVGRAIDEHHQRWMLCLAGALFISMLVMWIARHPVFTITAMHVMGEVRHNNEVTLRANVVPRLQGSFFTVDLLRAKASFENVPWVRQAVVRASFPTVCA